MSAEGTKMPELKTVAYGAFKREGVYRACHDFQALLWDVPQGARVDELVRKSDALAYAQEAARQAMEQAATR